VSHVVAIIATSEVGSRDATEFLRALAALAAFEVRVVIAEIGEGRGALDGGEWTADGEHYARALRDEGVAVLAADALPRALSEASAVFVLPDPARPGDPAVLTLALGTVPTPDQMKALGGAGQVRLE
jgi:hypothetical protein